MSANARAAAVYASLYAPSSRELTKPLPEIGNRIQGQLLELAMRPTPDGAEVLALQLEGVRRHVLKLRETLQRNALIGAEGDGSHSNDKA